MDSPTSATDTTGTGARVRVPCCAVRQAALRPPYCPLSPTNSGDTRFILSCLKLPDYYPNVLQRRLQPSSQAHP